MNEETNKEPRERMREIFTDDDEEQIPKYEQQPESPQPPAQPEAQTSQSPLAQLPKLKQTEQTPPPVETKVDAPKPVTPAPPVDLNKLPQQKKSAQPKQEPKQQPEKQPTQPADKKMDDSQRKQGMLRKEKFMRALWTIASLISITVSVVVVIVLILALWLFRDFKIPEGIDIMVLNKLLSGLYSNFELMDAANISAAIPVEDQIPVKFDLELKQPTTVILSEDVTIKGAYVIINTPVIDINAPAVVTLPAGTNLPIYLDLIVPVDKQVPVNLNVAVDIPLSETELHTPFVGLQEVVKPLYCLVEPAAASSLTGEPVCR
jgi:hypothetical protein